MYKKIMISLQLELKILSHVILELAPFIEAIVFR